MSPTIPAWPDPATGEGKTFFANASAILAAWKAHGVSNPFAFGMLAQAEAESSLDPNAKGDYYLNGVHQPWRAHPVGEPTSFGLYMRKAPRLAAIKAATGVDIQAAVLAGMNTVQADVDAAWWELTTQAFLGMKAIEAQATAYGAAMQACALFERAGALDAAERRGRMAERWTVWASGRWPASAGSIPAGWKA